MYRILFVTDNPTTRKPLKSALLEHSYAVTMLSSSELLAEGFNPPKADVLIVDLEQSTHEPLRLCHVIKRDPILQGLPLVLLVTEEQLGRLDLTAGVEDYLTLPISSKRLIERIKFLMWKLNKVEVKNGVKLKDLAVDFERYEVHIKGVPVELTYKEFELLKFLARQPGKVFSREVLLDKVWGYDFYGGTRTVDVHIRRLRAKIETGSTAYIETVRNVGYKFIGSASD